MFSFGIGRTKPTSGSIFGHGFGHSQETVGIWQNPIAEFGHASAQDFGSRVAPTWPWVEEYDRVEQEWYYANEETGETTWDQPPECKPPAILPVSGLHSSKSASSIVAARAPDHAATRRPLGEE